MTGTPQLNPSESFWACEVWTSRE